ncbi:MAG TPA: hypothetical protein VEU29_00875 [Actinomycetota bacterium]|nr:hypothetical protein [Actinomycetota bacterium]
MDSLLVEGIAVTVSSIIVFCGSVWLLLALVLGPRLAYFVSASITLAFLLLMGVVWSVGEPLGPVGELPSYQTIGAADDISEIQFGPAAEFPDGGGWAEAVDEAQLEIKTGAEGAATEALEEAIEAGDVTAFEAVGQASTDTDATRVLQEEDGTFFAAVRFEVLATPEDEEDAATDQDITPEENDDPSEDDAAAEEEPAGPDPDAEAFVILQQNPGNPSGEARMITVGFFGLLVLHLFGLSRSEKRARRVP